MDFDEKSQRMHLRYLVVLRAKNFVRATEQWRKGHDPKHRRMVEVAERQLVAAVANLEGMRGLAT